MMISFLPHPLTIVFVAAGINYEGVAGVLLFVAAGLLEVARTIAVANTEEP